MLKLGADALSVKQLLIDNWISWGEQMIRQIRDLIFGDISLTLPPSDVYITFTTAYIVTFENIRKCNIICG